MPALPLPLHRLPLAGMLLLLVGGALLAAWSPRDEPPAATTEAAAGTPLVEARVIVRQDRNTDVPGHVALEDENVIVIRRLEDGELQSFAKGRIVQIIRLVDPEPGQAGIVVLRDGDVRKGVIIEDAFDHVVMEIEGVRSKLSRQAVDYVALEPTFDERYAHFKATLDPEMAIRHLALCQWLVKERRYTLAKEELETLLANHPDIEDARPLVKLVDAQLTLLATPAEPSSPRHPAPLRPLPTGRLLTTEEVNLIRVYEIDFARPPKVVVPPETIRRLIESYGASNLIPAEKRARERLYTADPLDVIEQLIFKLRARELYPEIQVLTEPHALSVFRKRVHNAWLIHNCATSRCHGGPDGGRLFLHRRDHRDARVRYSNFLTLERLEIESDWPIINYDRPLDSLLIQYGLPANQARKPHPPVKGWKPAFHSANDRSVRATVDWIKAMMKPRTEYPVEYSPPVPVTTDANTGDRTPR